MSRIRIILLLIFWLPLQGIAAAGMPLCQSAWQPQHAVIDHPDTAARHATLHQLQATHHVHQHNADGQSGAHASCGECDNCHLCAAPLLPLTQAALPGTAHCPVWSYGPSGDFVSHIPLPLVDPPRTSL